MMIQDHGSPSSILLHNMMKKVNAYGNQPRVLVELDKYRYVKGLKQRYEVMELIEKESKKTLVAFDSYGCQVGVVIPVMPIQGKSQYSDMVETSPFWQLRKQSDGITYRHKGVDLDLETGDPIVAIWDGKISYADYNGGYGKVVYIDHGNNIETRYAHLSEIKVVKGTTVKTGEIIGLGGNTGHSTGSHLHFEIRKDGDTLNPTKVLKGEETAVKTELVDKTPMRYEVKEKVTYIDNFSIDPSHNSKFGNINNAMIFRELVQGMPTQEALNKNIFGFNGSTSGGSFEFTHNWIKDGYIEFYCYLDLVAGDKVIVEDSYRMYGTSWSTTTTRTLYEFIGGTSPKGLIFLPNFTMLKGEHRFKFTLVSSGSSKFGITKIKAVEFEEIYNKNLHWDFEDNMESSDKWKIMNNTLLALEGQKISFNNSTGQEGAGIYIDGTVRFPMSLKFITRISKGTTKFTAYLDDGTNLAQVYFYTDKTTQANDDYLIDNTVWCEYMITVHDAKSYSVFCKGSGIWNKVHYWAGGYNETLPVSLGNNRLAFYIEPMESGEVYIEDVKYAYKDYTKQEISTEMSYVEKEMWYDLGGFVFEETLSLEDDIISWEVNSHFDMSSATAKVTLSNKNGYYSPDYVRSSTFPDSLRESPFSYYDAGNIRHIISEYTPIRIYAGYGEQLVRIFTGMIKGEIEENASERTLSFHCVDRYDLIEECVLYKDLSFPPEEASYGDGMLYSWLKSSVVQALAVHAGMSGWRRHWDDLRYPDLSIQDTYYIDVDKGAQTVMKFNDDGKVEAVPIKSFLTPEGYKNPFVVGSVKFEIGERISDCINTIISDINFRAYCDRYGTFRLEQLDFINNMKWNFREGDSLMELTSSTDCSQVRNHLIITGSHGGQEHFFDKDLLVATKGHVRTAGLDIGWIDERDGSTALGQKKVVADKVFWDMKRIARTKNVVIKGNPLIDILDGCYVYDSNTSTAGYYLIKGNRLVGDNKGMLNFLELTWEEKI